ncbi:hypothetical protein SAMN05444487_11126 [Marininema mesophilum]|uniref:Uncharacterized protein n=1 Tax=Marininema mesophilum TaxID=1048340 RepID=A0A1H2ZF77_9BACL|nr:hypothetical protein [Marininema mesophilum]SDX15628.1 hypothetical protein SAMN05444487_11126 [Marininema mesophilum]
MPKKLFNFNSEDSKRMMGEAKRLIGKGIQTGKSELTKAIQNIKEKRAQRERELAYTEDYEAEFRYKDDEIDCSMLISAEEANIYSKARRKFKEVQQVQSDPRVHKQWEAKKYLSLHDHFSEKIEEYFPKRNDDPIALHRVIRYCERQIEFAPVARKAYEMDPYQYGLPAHPGYNHLILLYEEVSEWTDALRLAKEARTEGWKGDWDVRIRNLEDEIRKR